LRSSGSQGRHTADRYGRNGAGPDSVATVSVLIRTVEDSDLATIGALHYRSRTDAYAGLVSDAALAAGSARAMGEWWVERWRWERDTHRMSVAVDDSDRVVGFSYVGPSETAGSVELYAIHVDPTVVGIGVGRTLMADAIERLSGLAEPGTERAVLWVLAGNERARRFYERGGWTADGASRDSPIGPELVPQLRYSRSLPVRPRW
jgi:ribosomal protein S18 acetylase RimI-like enzyme